MLDLLVDGAAALGLPLDAGQVAQFQTYYEMLVDWNSRINLTAITDPDGVQTRHFVDSLAVAAALLHWEHGPQPDPGAARRATTPDISGNSSSPHSAFRIPHSALVDLGTGGGFPGLPLKILWPELRLTLVDSVGKKTLFLKAVVEALGLRDVTVLAERAETLGADPAYRAQYDIATARAVAALPVLAEYGLPLCRVGGILCAPKKGDLADELAVAARVVSRLGGGPLRDPFHYRLPGEDADRLVIGMPKRAPTPPAYPRRVGLARTRPLG
jgi:16S rRNA (guanine527-N7)-methyltransferase